MTTGAPTTCYRHPGRETGRRCTRCGRPACPECLRDAAVGAHCVECVRAAKPPLAARWQARWQAERLPVTKVLIAVNIVAFGYVALRDGRVDGGGEAGAQLALFGPLVHRGEWWRIVTSSVLHYGAVHLAFNMLALWIVGTILEPGAGATRFATLYGVSVLAGAAGALVATPHDSVGGASGGVYGVAAAAVLVLQRQGMRFWDTGLGPLLIINLVWSLTQSNVSVGGHVGGMVGGLLAAEAMIQARRVDRLALGYAGAAAVGVASVLLAFAVAGR